MINTKKYFSFGFTLIELLIVISIIGILAAFALNSYQGAQKQSRDTQRRSDLAQYRNALETYYNANNKYPDYSGAGKQLFYDVPHGTGVCPDYLKTSTAEYVTSCLTDSLGIDPYNYYYVKNSSMTVYVIYDKLETTGDYYYLCSSGKSGRVASAPVSCP